MAEIASPIKVRRRGPNPLVAALMLVAVAVLAYAPALSAGFIIDDPENVIDDARMGSIDGLSRIWTEIAPLDYRHQFYPLTTTAYWVQHHFFALEPMGYHAVNVLLHALNAILLWRLLRRLMVPGAWVAAVIFAVHPVHTETVAWVSELKSVLATFFCLASAWCFVKKAPGAISTGDHPRDGAVPEMAPGAFCYLLSLLFFAAALLSKPASALLPAALLIILWWKRSLDGRALAALAPMVLMASASAALAVYLETNHAAAGDTTALPLVEQWMLAGRSLGFYGSTLAWPVNLSFIHPGFTLDPANWADHAWSGSIVLLLSVLLAASPWIGRGPCAAVAIFVVALAPITFMNVAFTRFSPVADHWQYQASMPIIALAAAAGMHLWWIGRGVHLRRTAVLAILVYLAVLGGLTWQRATVFESARALWTDTVQRNPAAWIAHAELGRLDAESKDPSSAVAHYQSAIALRPADSSLHNNLGELWMRQSLRDMARAEYRRAIELDPAAPMPRSNLGSLLLAERNVGEAIEHLEVAVKLDPRFAPAQNNLGAALTATGRREEALAHYRQAVALDPRMANARYNLANELGALGRHAEAISEYHAVLAISPGLPAALNNLGAALLRAGRPDEAMRRLDEANRSRPGDGATLYNLSLASRALGRLEQAIGFGEAAVEVRPGDAAIRHTLGRHCLQAGHDLDGIRHLRAAVTLQPFFPEAHADLALALTTHPGSTPKLAAEAAEHAQRAAIQSDRNDASILRVLALALAANGRFDDSILTAVEAEAVATAGAAVAEVPD